MAGIFHPSRGGVRGGQDQFNWEDVKTDKDRENYLGHSVMVPVGKWQEGKDLIWYTRDKQKKAEAEAKRKKELMSIKSLEARAMAAALGHESFSSGTTSLTAKELQEVLSRGQTNHGSADVIKGMGYSKPQTGKQNKYGTEFVGGMQKTEVNQGSNVETSDVKHKSSKKRKKEKRKKKKKKKKQKKKKYESEEDFSEEEFEYSKTPHSSKYQSHSFKDDNKRSKDNEICKGKKRKSRDSDDGSDNRKVYVSESSCSEEKVKPVKRYKDNEKYNEKKRKFQDSDEDSRVGKKLYHLEINRDSRKIDSTKGKHKQFKDLRHRSEDESEGNIDRKYQYDSQSVHNSGKKSHTYSQPEDSRIKFTSRSKRQRHDSSSDGSSD